MSDYDSSLNNTSNNENILINSEQNSSNNFNNNYISNNGLYLNLSGVNLSSEEGLLLLINFSQKYPDITKINLSKCNLSSIPNEIYNLKKLSSLDICDNKFQNFEKLIEDLTKLNNLTDLKIDLNNQNQVLLTLSNFPNLLLLNGKSTKTSFSIVDIEPKYIEDISLQNYLDDYNDIVNKLNIKDETHSYANRFQKRIYEEGAKIKKCLTNNVPNYIYANTTLKSHLELQKNLAEKFLNYLDEENSILGKFLLRIIFQTGDKLVELINLLYPKIEEKTNNLRNELEEAWKAAGEISDFETKYKNVKNIKVILESNIDLMQKKNDKLKKENKILSQKLNKKAKDLINKDDKTKKKISSHNIRNYSDKNNYQNSIYNKATNSQDNINNNKESKYRKNNPNISCNQNNSYLKPSMNNSYNNKTFSYDINNIKNNIRNNINNSNDNTQINNNMNLTMNPNRKPLSIKITKDIINELYNSKVNYDIICLENRLPNETLEQYMYIFLNNKYGLKNLVIDWASAIINAIKLYSNEDCEINLFGKILRNEQEEDSRLILIKLKSNISELLEYYYKKKHPLKPQKEINKIMSQKKKWCIIGRRMERNYLLFI